MVEGKKTPLEQMDEEYCFDPTCQTCYPEVYRLGIMIQDIASLHFYLQGRKASEEPPIDLENVRTLRDVLLVMKPFVKKLNDLLQTIEPVEDTNGN